MDIFMINAQDTKIVGEIKPINGNQDIIMAVAKFEDFIKPSWPADRKLFNRMITSLLETGGLIVFQACGVYPGKNRPSPAAVATARQILENCRGKGALSKENEDALKLVSITCGHH